LGPYQQGNIGLITQSRPSQPVPSGPKPAGPVCPLNDCARLPIPSPPAEQPKLAPEKVFDELEENFTKEYESYLGVQGTRVKSLKETQKELEIANRESGLNTALVYVFFRNKLRTQKNIDLKIDSSSIIPFIKVADNSISDNNLKDDYILHILLITSKKACLIPVQVHESVENTDNLSAANKCTENSSKGFEHLTTFKDLNGRIDEFKTKTSSDWGNGFIPSSKELYKRLIQPIKSELKDIRHLAFIMDRGLRSLPLAALCKSGSDNICDSYLIQEKSLSLTPSYSLLRTDYQNISSERMWVLGTSEFVDQASKEEVNNPLLLTDFYMKTLTSNRVWGKESKSFSDRLFTKERLQACPDNKNPDLHECRPDVRIIHLITHAKFSANPKDSYIDFWGGRRLNMDEVQNLKLDSPPPPPIELLVLTACETAVGSEDAELGFAGAAVKTRVKTVMGSLWRVEEPDVLALSIDFYQHLKGHTPTSESSGKEKVTKAEALQKAQVAMITGNTQVTKNSTSLTLFTSNDRTNSRNPIEMPKTFPNGSSITINPLTHPKSWAGFTLVGTPW
jgi:CHAT domain-containing protein